MKDILFPEQKDYLESFIKENDPLILEMEAFAKKNNVPILSRDSTKLIELLIRIYRPERVLEIANKTVETLEKSIEKYRNGPKSLFDLQYSRNNYMMNFNLIIP